MVTARQIATEKLNLYFFLSVLDEDKAQEGIVRTWKALNTKTLNWKRPPKNWESVLISQAEKVRAGIGRGLTIRRSGVLQKLFPLQAPVDWADWFEFLKNGNPKEISVVVWVKILGLEEAKVAEALKISRGTVRYRLNRGLLELGRILESGSHA